MKKVLILFGEDKYAENDYFKKDIYKQSYEYLYQLAEKNGIRLFRSSYKWYDKNEGVFLKALTFEDGRWITIESVVPDLIYDKTEFSNEIHCQKKIIGEKFKIINDPDFSYVCNNKFMMSSLMPKYFKKYEKVTSKLELIEMAKKIQGEKLVIKPIYGSGGENVQIVDKDEIEKIGFEGTVIIQEFIDSSKGIDGIVNGTHDLRLVMVDNELIYSYIRQPAEGSFLANVAQGGTMTVVEKVPDSVWSLVENFKELFGCFKPKIYTIDLMFDQDQKPWIVEVNTMPGIYFTEDQNIWRDKMYLRLINIFKEYAV